MGCRNVVPGLAEHLLHDPRARLCEQTLDGVITLTSSAGSSFNYNSQFSNVARTSLAVTGAAELVWATETLEAYGITAISDYPAGATELSLVRRVCLNPWNPYPSATGTAGLTRGVHYPDSIPAVLHREQVTR
ncbi:hypothetical protein GGX14DRAFT_405256 [Mycena pura]|uniref:Uncharacterized protein n=1 Tax=Mycena pura TaxID=153505 RepID=A0AAD6XZC4_9AGAR|nr:hypothetical protein GGX14DRAFT_405256 [Mycena pura]